MADLSKILEGLAGQSGNVEQLTKSLNQLKKASSDAFSAGDPKLLAQVRDMEKAMQRLIKSTKDKTAVEEEMRDAYDKSVASGKKVVDITDNQIEAYNRAADEHEEATSEVLKGEKAKIAAFDKAAESNKRYEEQMIKYAKEHTVLGKAYGMLTSGLAKMTAGLTFSGLAMKAAARHMEAAEVRQKILIQNYRDLHRETMTTKDGTIGFTGQILNLSTAMKNAEATAHRMGVSADVVGDSFVRFSRVAGTDNPKALQTLTEGAIVTSRTLGITVPEAIDFVSTRMDKFGGSAAEALVSLNQMREEAKSVNDAFGRTVVRGDDIARTLQDISTQTNVYAIDQRLVGSVLRDNIARLMATGESYDMARMKAQAFTKGIAGDAPEWMQVLAGQDIMGDMLKVYGEGGKKGSDAFMDKFGAQLNAAKPGLAKKVEGILGDIASGKVGAYEGSRLIQELTAQSEVGMMAMNDQILKLSRTTNNSIEVISKQFGVSRDVARSMVKQAEQYEKDQLEINKLEDASVEILVEKLKITREEAIRIQNNRQEISKAYRQQEMIVAKGKEKERMAEEHEEKIKNLKKDQTSLQMKYNAAVASGDKLAQKVLKEEMDKKSAELKAAEEAFGEAKKKGFKLEPKLSGMDKIAKITETQKKDFKEYSIHSGNYFKELIAKMSDASTLAITAGVVGIGYLLNKWFNWTGRANKKVAELLTKGVREGTKGDKELGGTVKKMSKHLGQKVDQLKSTIAKGFKRPSPRPGSPTGPGAAGGLTGRAAEDRAGMVDITKDKKKTKAEKKAERAEKKAEKKGKRKGPGRKGRGKGRGRGGLADMLGGQDCIPVCGGMTGSGMMGDATDMMDGDRDKDKDSEKGKKKDTGRSKTRKKKKGFMGMIGKVLDVGKKVIGKAGGGIFGKILGFAKPLLKGLSKLGGFVGAFIGVLFELPELIAAFIDGDFKAAFTSLIPMITGALGGLLGSLGGPVGTMIGGTLGSLAGDYLRDWLMEMTPAEAVIAANEKLKKAKEEHAEAVKSGDLEEIKKQKEKLEVAEELLKQSQDNLVTEKQKNLEAAKSTKDDEKIDIARKELESAYKREIPKEEDSKKEEKKPEEKKEVAATTAATGATGQVVEELKAGQKKQTELASASIDTQSKQLGISREQAVAMQTPTNEKSIAEGVKQGVKQGEGTPPEAGSVLASTGITSPASAAAQKAAQAGRTTKRGPLDTSTATDVKSIDQAMASTGTGEATGTFMGGPNPDGSIMLKVDNFMGAMSGAKALQNRGMKTT